MSPTMTEGGIAQWKIKEGDAFHTGDVLLEVETDKATIEVEAQDDGVLGKIISPDGSKNIAVGKTIALIAEEGDDISNLEAPKEKEEPAKASQKSHEEAKPQLSKTTQSALHESTSQPVHHDISIQSSKPLFPSVQRLLAENGIENADQIKGTGVRGMLTKGDVLAFLGKASSPSGTYKPVETETPAPKPAPKPAKEQPKSLDGEQLRQTIAAGLAKSSRRPRLAPPVAPYDFDSIVNDYLPSDGESTNVNTPKPAPSKQTGSADSYIQGLL
ncbi:single hybrid motif-containing protein [Sanghuangporus baumii]|uniref:Single hybrid motif-containing protein n=1 Tax=Sanghuangporus baumii TaxID=108892 RepID=A0A9Q5N4E6_SANBA|nr:single hybrid motif-containing protein [Sanghuangporus baumii]